MTPDKNAGEPGITAKPGNDLQKYDWDLVGTYDETIVQLVSIKNKKIVHILGCILCLGRSSNISITVSMKFFIGYRR